MRKKNTILMVGFTNDMRVRHRFESLVEQVNGVVPLRREDFDNSGRDSHVGEKPHADAGSSGWILSSASQAAYFRAWRMSSAAKYG